MLTIAKNKKVDSYQHCTNIHEASSKKLNYLLTLIGTKMTYHLLSNIVVFQTLMHICFQRKNSTMHRVSIDILQHPEILDFPENLRWFITRKWSLVYNCLKFEDNVPGIVLSSTKPAKPPTNMLVRNNTRMIWSQTSFPENKHS